jgi:CheY-like chemotaxis protein
MTNVVLEVSDTGAGMDEETRGRCLEPFFTTKGERGTGLGLAMVYGMTQRHGAEIEIESSLNVGTTIRLIFPSGDGKTASGAAQPLTRPTRSLRVLVVDDDPIVIQSIRAVLESDGHRVTTSDGGQAGIDEFIAAQQRGEPFEAVITDLGMPYVDGRRVAASVKQGSPRTPVILLTGWGVRLMADDENPVHVDRILCKPAKLAELRRVLAELTEPGAMVTA